MVQETYPLMKGIPLFDNKLVDTERGFDEVYSAIKENRLFYIVSGVRALSKNHLGYKFLSQTINSLTELGGEGYVFMPEIEDKLSGIEQKSLESISLNSFFRSLSKEVKVLSDSKLSQVVEVILQQTKKYSIKRILRTFGLKEEDNFGKFMSLIYSTSSYFSPNILNNTDFPTLILGIPSHKSIVSFSRELAESNSLRKPSAVLFKLMPGKDGSDKMSNSRPSSCIYIGEEQKFLSALTGGRPSKEEQLKLGGEFEKCIALKLAKYFVDHQKIEEVISKCNDGELCRICKENLLTIISN